MYLNASYHCAITRYYQIIHCHHELYIDKTYNSSWDIKQRQAEHEDTNLGHSWTHGGIPLYTLIRSMHHAVQLILIILHLQTRVNQLFAIRVQQWSCLSYKYPVSCPSLCQTINFWPPAMVVDMWISSEVISLCKLKGSRKSIIDWALRIMINFGYSKQSLCNIQYCSELVSPQPTSRDTLQESQVEQHQDESCWACHTKKIWRHSWY